MFEHVIEIKYSTCRFCIIAEKLQECRVSAIRVWFRMIRDELWRNEYTKQYLDVFIPNETRAAKDEMELAAERVKQDKRYRDVVHDAKRNYDKWSKVNSIYKEILG